MGGPVRSRSVTLPTGRIDVTVDTAHWPLDALCDFAARENPKRGFLVVSRVLGRHIPARPQAMRRSVRDLAALIPDDLPGPVLVVGLAETAVCLGQTLFEEWRTRTGRDDGVFLHSTRQVIDAPALCRFEEPHSHASAHILYCPQVAGFGSPATLILVDDEVSTGTTLTNLATELALVYPSIEAIVVATLTDWSARGDWLGAMPRPARIAALLHGRLTWTQEAAAGADAAFDRAAASLGTMAAHRNFGRTGIAAPLCPSPLTPLPPIDGPLRIIGTGEFTYLPFRLAESLAAAGHDVVVQATSRSPARLGGAMASKLCFADNYRTGVPNYLYNALSDGRANWIAHETGADTIDPALIAALDAKLVGWAA